MLQKWFVMILLFVFASALVYADPPYAASRNVDRTVYYYETLHEAVEAAVLHSSFSPDAPDEIFLLADVILYEPVIIDTTVHIGIVAYGGSRTIMRGSGNLEYPLFWITGVNSSLTLGAGSGMEHELFIDGGYLNTPSIQAHATLITLNGQGAKLIMYDNVYLQNNFNVSAVPGTATYQQGSGVLIRTVNNAGDLFLGTPAEFIMKGGTIRGNTNNTRDYYTNGAGVLMVGSCVFTMEGGVIMNNTAGRTGGGVFIDIAGTFRKSGGIIYGKNAPEGYRNTAVDGYGNPSVYGHAISVFNFNQKYKFRDDTIGENENLSYTGALREDGVYGKGERWDDHYTTLRRILLICTLSVFALSIPLFLFFLKKYKQKNQIKPREKSKALIEAEAILTEREKDVFHLLLTGKTVREISMDLASSISSINTHSEKIYRKLNIQSRTELLVKFKG